MGFRGDVDRTRGATIVSSLESADHVDQGHLLRIYASHCGFLHFAETRHPLRSQAVELSQKIEFVFPASSEQFGESIGRLTGLPTPPWKRWTLTNIQRTGRRS